MQKCSVFVSCELELLTEVTDLISLKCYRMVGVGGRSALNNSRALLVRSSEYYIACQPLKGR